MSLGRGHANFLCILAQGPCQSSVFLCRGYAHLRCPCTGAMLIFSVSLHWQLTDSSRTAPRQLPDGSRTAPRRLLDSSRTAFRLFSSFSLRSSIGPKTRLQDGPGRGFEVYFWISFWIPNTNTRWPRKGLRNITFRTDLRDLPKTRVDRKCTVFGP